MHYVICYDIEDDALRGKTARLLESRGCERVQRSVYVAARLARRDRTALERDLRQLFALAPAATTDSVLLIPLRDEHTAGIIAIGANNTQARFDDPPRSIRL